jgi:hypothetical protein
MKGCDETMWTVLMVMMRVGRTFGSGQDIIYVTIEGNTMPSGVRLTVSPTWFYSIMAL